VKNNLKSKMKNEMKAVKRITKKGGGEKEKIDQV